MSTPDEDAFVALELLDRKQTSIEQIHQIVELC